jgi:multiple sugar transport system substrate-binding protein
MAGRAVSIVKLAVLVQVAVMGLVPAPALAQRTLTVLSWSDYVPAADKKLLEQAERFGKANNVKVEVNFVSLGDLPAKTSAAALANSGPDIINLWYGTPHVYADSLVDVDEVVESLGKRYGGWYDAARAANFAKGRWKAVPWSFLPYVVHYRKDLLQQVGESQFPDTYDDLLRVGKKLKAKGFPIGMSLGHALGDANLSFYPIWWAFGGKEVDKDGRVLVGSPETAAAIEYVKALYRDAMDPSVLSWGDPTNNMAMLAGKIAVTFTAPSIYSAARTQAPQLRDKYDHALPPRGPAGRFAGPLVVSLGIFKYSKNQDLAKKFLGWLMEREQASEWIAASDGMHASMLRAFEKDPFWSSDPKFAPLQKVGAYVQLFGYPGTPTQKAEEVRSRFIIVDMFAKAVQGMPTKDAIAWAVAEIRKIYTP